MRPIYLLAALGTALTLVLTGCGGRPAPGGTPITGQEEPMAPDHPVIAIQDKPVPIAEQMKGQTGIVQVAITDSGFEPAILRAPEGSRVKIHVRNASEATHNLVIGRFGIVTSPLPPGSENYIEFTASSKGEWPIVSDVQGAPEPGFQAVLKVE